MSKPTLTVTEDFTADFNKLIKSFKGDNVLIGIPEEDTQRHEDKEDINNATLLAINNFGSPGQNIPARPVMQIGITNAKEQIADEYKKAVQSSFKGGFNSLRTYFERAGIIASNSVKKAINDQDFGGAPGPSDATLETRRREGFKGTKSLIVTGQMRNAVTYVLKGE